MADAPAQPTDPLAGLVDIPLPVPVSLWPMTWTSRIVVMLFVLGSIAALWWFVRWRRANRYRRLALGELGRIEHDMAAGAPAAQVTDALVQLVRRTALAAFPRPVVAPLSGDSWLSFLDRSYGGEGFSQGPGHVLGRAVYQPQGVDAAEVRGLIDLVRQWIRTHHG